MLFSILDKDGNGGNLQMCVYFSSYLMHTPVKFSRFSLLMTCSDRDTLQRLSRHPLEMDACRWMRREHQSI